MYPITTASDPEKNLRRMVSAVAAALEDAPTPTAALANTSAFIMAYMPGLNWAGFYILESGRLTLGPFQGLPACTEIALGAGVCGAAAREGRTQVVEDVEAFPGHIACDSASAAELVVPVTVGGALWGVIDLDSPQRARFSALEAGYLEEIARLVGRYLEERGGHSHA